MNNELENLKSLYFSNEEDYRELAEQIIKGNTSLGKALKDDVISLGIAVFGSTVPRSIGKIRDRLIEKVNIIISDYNNWTKRALNDLKYLNPSVIKVIRGKGTQLSSMDDTVINTIPDFIWEMGSLKRLEVYKLPKMNIPKNAKNTHIEEFKVYESNVCGIENLPDSTEIIVLNECYSNWLQSKGCGFKYSYIKNEVDIRSLGFLVEVSATGDFSLSLSEDTQPTKKQMSELKRANSVTIRDVQNYCKEWVD